MQTHCQLGLRMGHKLLYLHSSWYSINLIENVREQERFINGTVRKKQKSTLWLLKQNITSPESQEIIALLPLGFNKTLKSGW